MLTRVFLAAGAAVLAIAAPAYADKGGHGGGGGHGNGGGGPPAAAGGGGHGNGGDGGHGGGQPQGSFGGGGGGGHGHGGGQPQAFFGGGGGGHGHGGGQPEAFFGGGGGGHGHGQGGGAAPQMRAERQQGHGFQRVQSRGFERQQAQNVERQQGRGFERQQARNAERQGRGLERQQARNFERQQNRAFERQQARNFERQNARGFERQQARNFNRDARGIERSQAFVKGFAGERANGKAARFANREAVQNWNPASYRTLAYADNIQVLPVPQVEQFVGVPVAQVANFAALSPLPATIQYLYPDTPDYYYRYGDGYLYQVDRGTSLIDALIPLMAGGFLPGQYLPNSYMNSYVPAYYGFNSFYPDYGNVCNRYYQGVVYQVDCDDGYVENVIPMYAGGYGVGQILPSAYSYYNVPVQYRSLYYDTPDYGYWYSPGAIYQYDTRSSMITSVAALLSPGFTIGQPLPMGYDVYNVPYDYRATYYDTPNAWYRYSNGYIYQVDPVTQLVTAIVASLLT